MTRHSSPFLFIVLFLLLSSPFIYAQDSDDIDESESDTLEFDLSMSPTFSRPTRGAGIALGFGLTGLKPSTLDPDLSGDLVLTSFEVYIIRKGLLIGGSWTGTTLYDAPDNYDKFDFGYAGLLLGYDHSLFYGRLSIRPSLLIGGGDLTMIRSRPDLTVNPLLNPDGKEVLERLREQDFFMLRPGFGLGWSPTDFLQFRTDLFFMYPTGGDDPVDDLREALYTFSVVFGSNR